MTCSRNVNDGSLWVGLDAFGLLDFLTFIVTAALYGHEAGLQSKPIHDNGVTHAAIKVLGANGFLVGNAPGFVLGDDQCAIFDAST